MSYLVECPNSTPLTRFDIYWTPSLAREVGSWAAARSENTPPVPGYYSPLCEGGENEEETEKGVEDGERVGPTWLRLQMTDGDEQGGD